MSLSKDLLPAPTACDSFGPPPDFDTPTQSAFDNGMILGQSDTGEATWQHTHIRVVGRSTSGALVPGHDVYWVSDNGAPLSLTLWNPLAVLLCDQNELWIKNVSTFPLTITLAAGTFDFNDNTLILPGKTGLTGNTGAASVHLVCQPQTANWLVVASHNM